MSRLRDTLQANLRGVHERITQAARGAGRSADDIVLLAVSKTFAPAAVREAWEGLGYYRRAENLRRLAKVVIREYEGRLPDEPAAEPRLRPDDPG